MSLLRVLPALARYSGILTPGSGRKLCTCTCSINAPPSVRDRARTFCRYLHSVRCLHQDPYHVTRRSMHLSAPYRSDPLNDAELKNLIKEIASDFNEDETDTEDINTSSLVGNKSTGEVENEGSKPVDIDTELLRYDYEEFDIREEEDEEDSVQEEVYPIPLTRGENGVFDIEDLVELLRCDNADDICVISIASELEFVDHMVIVTGRSIRHITAIAFYVKKLYKRKRNKGDPASCKIEGRNSSWIAMDLGNIFLHLFMAETRELYDLETLWTVGPKYDRLSREMPDVPDFSWVDAYTSDFQQFGGINTSNQNNEDTRARTGPEEYSGKRNHKHQHNKT